MVKSIDTTKCSENELQHKANYQVEKQIGPR